MAPLVVEHPIRLPMGWTQALRDGRTQSFLQQVVALRDDAYISRLIGLIPTAHHRMLYIEAMSPFRTLKTSAPTRN